MKALSLFFYSTAALLGLTALAKFWSITGDAAALGKVDPVLHLSYGKLMLFLGLLEGTIAGYLIFGRSRLLRATAVFWLSVNFMTYRFAMDFLGISLCPCLGSLTAKLPFTKGQVESFLMWSVLYLFFGSSYILLSEWAKRNNQSAPCGTVDRDTESVTRS